LGPKRNTAISNNRKAGVNKSMIDLFEFCMGCFVIINANSKTMAGKKHQPIAEILFHKEYSCIFSAV
jgi:hypothetical protein